MNKYTIVTLAIFLLSLSVKAQDPLSLYYLENIPQRAAINPAMTPRANVYVGFPAINSIYTALYTDILGPDMIQKTGGRYVTLTNADFDFGPIYDRIGEAANFNTYQSITPIAFGFKNKKGYFTFSWSEKINQSVAIPKDFFTILDKGLKAGTSLDLSPIGLNAKYYREWSFGYSYNFMSNLRVGIHAKLLQGIAAVKTDFDKFDLNIGYKEPGDERHSYYDLDMRGTIYMSAPIEVVSDEEGIIEDYNMPDISTDLIMDVGVFNFSNPGFAVDLGAMYELNEDWSFSASLNDLGFIKWSGDLNSISMNGEYTYEGLKIDGSNIEETSDALEQMVDSIESSVNYSHSTKGFSTGLGPKIYLGAQYHVNHYFSAGALSRTVFAKNDFRQEFNISANVNLYRALTTTLNYTVAVNGANTVGFGFALRGGSFQLYMVADYLPYAYRKLSITSDEGDPTDIPVVPTKLDNFNLMFGINLLFGPNGFKDEPMLNSYSEF